MTDVPLVTRLAAAAASERLRQITESQRPPQPPRTRLRTGKRTAMAISALKRLRRDIQIGVPHAALLDRIDDELFKLEKS